MRPEVTALKFWRSEPGSVLEYRALMGDPVFAGRGVPAFWPIFCMAYDAVAAACLAALIVWRGKAPVSPSP